MLPNFLIIGAMKSGTTSLYSYLRTHPDIFMPTNKEPGFFSNEPVWNKGIIWYESLFAGSENQKARGEASVNYTKHPYYENVPSRIQSLCQDVKLIYILRSPVERIYSHYLHNVYAAIESLPFEQAIEKRPLYIQASQYYFQIEQYLDFFPRDNLLILILDDMKSNPLGTVKQVFNFIGVDNSFIPPNINEVKHQAKLKRGRDNALMKILRRSPFYHYLSDILPDNIKAFSGIMLKQKLQGAEPISGKMHNVIIDRIKPDTLRLSEFLRRDLDFWDLDKRPVKTK